MFTLNELKNFCEKNNIRYEINPRYAENGYYSMVTKKWDHVQVGWWFGMNNISGTKQSENQWVWYSSLEDELEDKTLFWFDHRFSCGIGVAYRGINESMKANNTIERRMA